jgi:hypothetical protein
MIPLREDGTLVFGILLLPIQDRIHNFSHFGSWDNLKTLPTIETFQPVGRTRRRWSEV